MLNYAFLFLDLYVESVCLEKMMVKHRKAVLGGNLRDVKEKRDWWKKPLINTRKKQGMNLKKLERERQQEEETD